MIPRSARAIAAQRRAVEARASTARRELKDESNIGTKSLKPRAAISHTAAERMEWYDRLHPALRKILQNAWLPLHIKNPDIPPWELREKVRAAELRANAVDYPGYPWPKDDYDAG